MIMNNKKVFFVTAALFVMLIASCNPVNDINEESARKIPGTDILESDLGTQSVTKEMFEQTTKNRYYALTSIFACWESGDSTCYRMFVGEKNTENAVYYDWAKYHKQSTLLHFVDGSAHIMDTSRLAEHSLDEPWLEQYVSSYEIAYALSDDNVIVLQTTAPLGLIDFWMGGASPLEGIVAYLGDDYLVIDYLSPLPSASDNVTFTRVVYSPTEVSEPVLAAERRLDAPCLYRTVPYTSVTEEQLDASVSPETFLNAVQGKRYKETSLLAYVPSADGPLYHTANAYTMNWLRTWLGYPDKTFCFTLETISLYEKTFAQDWALTTESTWRYDTSSTCLVLPSSIVPVLTASLSEVSLRVRYVDAATLILDTEGEIPSGPSSDKYTVRWVLSVSE